MSDEPVEVDPEDPEVDEEDEDEESDDEEEAPKPAGRNFVDLPEGYLTLVGFSHLLAKKTKDGGRNTKVSSQVLYSTAKNTKSFPNKSHVDGRQIINVDEGLAWWDEKEDRKKARLAEAQAQMEAEGTEDEDDEEAVEAS